MARLSLDYANCLSIRVEGQGIDLDDLEAARPRIAELTDRLNRTKGTGWERWRLLPFDPLRSEHVNRVMSIVSQKKEWTENLIVLGIGGSALGNIALQAALNPLLWNLMPNDQRDGPRLFILDNVDPQFVGETFNLVERDDPGFERTLVNVISKSGETAETAAQFIIARSKLRKALGDRHREHIVAITDAEKGTMRSICDREGYATLPVPEGVGGRFSVLSPVGLFSAAMCGFDIESLLEGAAAMDARCSEPDLMKNPAAMIALLLAEFTNRGRRAHVMMPYANALYSLADWYRQLWAESLGKRVDREGREIFAGATPVKALGATDQHSQIQLYREGPHDKVVCFLEVESFDRDVPIPSDLDVENLRYLQGATLAALIQAEKRATEYALVESGRPNFTIRFPTINAHHVGEFIQLWEIATAYAGLLFNIDPYDQPAVETGKIATFGLMGRESYNVWKERVEETLRDTRWRM